MLPKGRAYSRLFVHLSDRPSVCPSHFCLEHISKSIEGNLMKLDTLIEGHEGNCRKQEPSPCHQFYGLTSLLNFCSKKLVWSISLKV